MIIFGVDPGTATTGYGVIKRVTSDKLQVTGNAKKLGKGKQSAEGLNSRGVKDKSLSFSDINLELVDYGCIVTPKEMEMPLRLFNIQKELKSLLVQYKPDCVIVEQLFFGINSRTAMTVGQARGVVLSTAAGAKIPIFEYQGLHVKNILTGSGKADKKQIQKYVMKYLNKRKLKKPLNGYLDDAADALAVAICHVIKTEFRD